MQPDGGRDLAMYEEQLGFTREQLLGKRVLDLGAGPEAKLARQLAAECITSLVTSFSPDYSTKNHRAQVKATGGERPKEAYAEWLVSGKGQELPFRDDSFDVVLGLHVAEHVSVADSVRILGEINRVTTPGGWARFGTIISTFGEDVHYTAKDDYDLQLALARKGNILEQTYVDRTIITPQRIRHDAALTYYADHYLLTIGQVPLPRPTNYAPAPTDRYHP